jgi:ATP synthase protein I
VTDNPVTGESPPNDGSGRPSVDLSAQIEAAAKIADRSRSAGAWSLAHLRLCLPVLAGGGLVLGVVGAVVAGWGAVLGVLIGTVIVGAFFTFSAVVIAWVGRTNPNTVMIAALFAYVIKVFVLALILMTMPIDGPVNVRWMAGAIGLGVFLWLGAHMRYVWTLKLYYVDPR